MAVIVSDWFGVIGFYGRPGVKSSDAQKGERLERERDQ